ncbi:hypothetical protein J6590_032495 [Homalodisca vitripennis]|nr:hypothetical protein J6590_032495 [Homalodisca vitripennis]
MYNPFTRLSVDGATPPGPHDLKWLAVLISAVYGFGIMPDVCYSIHIYTLEDKFSFSQ